MCEFVLLENSTCLHELISRALLLNTDYVVGWWGDAVPVSSIALHGLVFVYTFPTHNQLLLLLLLLLLVARTTRRGRKEGRLRLGFHFVVHNLHSSGSQRCPMFIYTHIIHTQELYEKKGKKKKRIETLL